jgi:hypothetical protein
VITAESLGRAFNASVLTNSPHTVYGVSVAESANETSDGPYVTLTEMRYTKNMEVFRLTTVPPDRPT